MPDERAALPLVREVLMSVGESDGTRLGDELAKLEREDPAVRKSAQALEDFTRRRWHWGPNYTKPIEEWTFDDD